MSIRITVCKVSATFNPTSGRRRKPNAPIDLSRARRPSGATKRDLLDLLEMTLAVAENPGQFSDTSLPAFFAVVNEVLYGPKEAPTETA